MTRNQIISQLFTGKNFNQCIAKMEPAHLQNDLKMEVIAIVCEWSDERIIGLYERKELDFFVVRVILNQIQSNSSPFYRKYRRFLEDFTEFGSETFDDGNSRNKHTAKIGAMVDITNQATSPEDIEERLTREIKEERALDHIDGLYWYNAGLLKLYATHGNYRAIQKATGIPFVSCYKAIQKSIKELKEKVLCSTGI